MSCIRFSTPAQRATMADDAAALAEAERAVVHRSPEITASKVARLRLLAEHPRPGIRQSAASSLHAPADLLVSLADDADPAVRAEVARNETAPPALLAALAQDSDPRVRSWTTLNTRLPVGALAALGDDADGGVRRLAGFRLSAAG